jgi:catechol 2,3-dioxygenase-like lactoylglutathione lyase family enzyme
MGSEPRNYRLRQVALDCNDLELLIGFWTAAIGYRVEHHEATWALLRDPNDQDPKLFLQRVPEPRAGKNRMHLDIEVPDEQGAVERLVALGARSLWRMDFGSHYWTVLADPEGNEFCVGRFGSL